MAGSMEVEGLVLRFYGKGAIGNWLADGSAGIHCARLSSGYLGDSVSAADRAHAEGSIRKKAQRLLFHRRQPTTTSEVAKPWPANKPPPV